MKYILFGLLFASLLASCISHKAFTYKCDGRPTDLDKHLKITGSYVNDTFISYSSTPHYRISMKEIFLYADGTVNLGRMDFSDVFKMKRYLNTNWYPYMIRNAVWGQCRVVGDTLLVQKLVHVGRFHNGIAIDTFIIHSDTLLELVTSNPRWGSKPMYHYRASARKDDSSYAPIRDHNWYWTKRYKDSVYHRGEYKRK